MRHYETIFIADPDLAPDVQEILFEKARSLISGNQGDLVDFDEWGNRRLAYEIRKKQRGHYVRLDYCGNGRTVREFENAFRIDERVLKFMTIFIADNADPEQLKEAVAAGKQATVSEESPPAEETSPEKPEGDQEKTAAATDLDDTDSGNGSDNIPDTGTDTGTDAGEPDSGREL